MKMGYKKEFKRSNVLPNFIGIGALRCGTTQLYKTLLSHPEVYLCPYRKELHFFDNNFKKGLDWYKKFFPKISKAEKYKAIGEITPRYIYDKNTPLLISKVLPNARFILILRNPVDRIFFQYKYHKMITGYKISINEFLKRFLCTTIKKLVKIFSFRTVSYFNL